MQILRNHTSSHAVKHIKSDAKQKVKYGHTSEQYEKKVMRQSFSQLSVIEVILNKAC